jgi:uncharacterized short protein YbdD (DUF466 family)
MSRALRLAKYVWNYLKEVSGENAYDRYVERHYATHPEKEPLKRGEFYRWRQDALYGNPGNRCP